MRIISKFHDYYDSVMRNGQDFDLIYLRKTEELSLEGSQWPGVYTYCPVNSAPWGYATPQLDVREFIVGFCGKIYPGVRLTNDWNVHRVSKEAICYSLEEVDAFIAANYKKRSFDAYKSTERRSWRNRDWASSCSRARFKEYFETVKAKKDAFGKFFLDKKVPIFLVERKLILNPCLKDVDFVRVFDTYAAFQELQMYLGGLASPEKPIPHVSDKDLLACKGFNKWSFRKPPADGS